MFCLFAQSGWGHFLVSATTFFYGFILENSCFLFKQKHEKLKRKKCINPQS